MHLFCTNSKTGRGFIFLNPKCLPHGSEVGNRKGFDNFVAD